MAEDNQPDIDLLLLEKAIRIHQLGYYAAAAPIYMGVLNKYPDNERALYYYTKLRRQAFGAPNPAPWKVIWHVDPQKIWEGDWIRYCLDDVHQDEHIVDTSRTRVDGKMVVIADALSAASEAFYRTAYLNGCKVVLIHISDEFYNDDCGSYKWCDAVFRNYWSFLYANAKNIHTIPLGYKTGFSKGLAPKPARERRYLWSFMGDVKKANRAEVVDAMRGVGDGFVHVTSGFHSSDSLPTDQYRAVMDDSIFVPCPRGNANFESFRVWEALEAGCIPIAERRSDFDYFQKLCPSHPFPVVTQWDDIASICQQSPEHIEHLRLTCAQWWRVYKIELKAQMLRTLSDVFTYEA